MSFSSKHLTLNQVNTLTKNLGEENINRLILGDGFHVVWEKHLKSLGLTTLSPQKINKKKFFLRGSHGGLTYVNNEFETLVLDWIKDEILYKGGELEKFKLEKHCRHFHPLEEIGERLIQTPTLVAGQIASLVSKQSKGEKGELLSNGMNNIFYFRRLPEDQPMDVSVVWESGIWNCYSKCPPFDTNTQWCAGDRVFTPKN